MQPDQFVLIFKNKVVPFWKLILEHKSFQMSNMIFYNFYFFLLVKCTDSECPLHSACVDNKCKCMEGFVDVNGVCEGKLFFLNVLF